MTPDAAKTAASTAGAPAGERITICCYCRKRVYRQRNGAWYHRRNASTSCHPGEGSEKRATPLEITVRRDAGQEA